MTAGVSSAKRHAAFLVIIQNCSAWIRADVLSDEPRALMQASSAASVPEPT